MRKAALVLLLSIVNTPNLLAATGDTSDGRVTYSGYVPGFVANDGFIVTGKGGSLDPNDFSGALSIQGDGTFTTLTPVRLEGRAWNDSTSEVGALQAADWQVTGVQVLNVAFGEVADKIEVKDAISGTTVVASSIGAGATLADTSDSVEISISNTTAVTDSQSIAGEDLQIAVDIIATSN